MEISSSQYHSQSITSLLTDTASSAPLSESLVSTNKSSAIPPSTGPSYGRGYTSFQQSLAASYLDGSASLSSSSAMKNAEGLTLAEASSKGTINPADWLSQSDKDLYHKVTGGSIKDGIAYDADGNPDWSERSQNLIDSLYQMRNYGTFDSQGNMTAITGTITASDRQGYIDHYSRGGWFSSDMGILDETMKALTSEQA
ncbi:hypothetical protein [Rhizobium sp. NPDC090279]|uniref:hypothetical protein n=1 Tax=Rhizobium sp. NPDC090279 TaxID=3364499 RepID=UPI00383AE816